MKAPPESTALCSNMSRPVSAVDVVVLAVVLPEWSHGTGDGGPRRIFDGFFSWEASWVPVDAENGRTRFLVTVGDHAWLKPGQQIALREGNRIVAVGAVTDQEGQLCR